MNEDIIQSRVSEGYIPAIEKATADEIKNFQELKLKKQLTYLNNYSPYYKRLFKRENIDVNTITKIEDLVNIPVTTKEDLQAYNQDFICVDNHKIIDYITTSGTLGEPVTFALTDHDLERLAYNEAISFVCACCGPADVIQLTTTIDKRFMAGLAYFMGARKLGAGIVRVGAGIPNSNGILLKGSSLQPWWLCHLSYSSLSIMPWPMVSTIATVALKELICIGEALRSPDLTLNTLAERIHALWDIPLFSTYASTEMATAFTDCSHGTGGHHHPELIIVEFLDEQNQPVGPGEAGEVTITTLGVEGMPLLRFKTGDLCHHYANPCECGRNTMRLGPVIGRQQQMIKFKGTTLYPPALYDILDEIEEVENYIVEVFTNDIGTDDIRIRVGLKGNHPNFEKEIKDHFRARLRVSPSVEFLPVDVIRALQFPEMSRKAVKFVDNRKK